MEQLNQFMTAITPYLITIVTAFAGYVAVVVKKKLSEKLDTQTKKEVAEATVKYIEQVYNELDGKDKLKKALETSIAWLNEKGIKITEVEATILIEAAIKSFQQSWSEAEIAKMDLNYQKASLEFIPENSEPSTENTEIEEEPDVIEE